MSKFMVLKVEVTLQFKTSTIITLGQYINIRLQGLWQILSVIDV